MPGETDITATETQVEKQYPPHIRAAVELARVAAERGEKILIVGGTAYDFLTNKDLKTAESHNESGLRDVDVIFGMGTKIKELVESTRERLSEEGLPEVKIETASDIGRQVILNEDGKDYLFFKRLYLSIDPKIFEPIIFVIDGVEVPVARPQTLFYLFRLFSGKYDREKDERRAQVLKDEVFDEYPIDFDESYRVFEEYWEVRQKYYGHSMSRKAKWLKRHRQGVVEEARPLFSLRKPISRAVYKAEDIMADLRIPKRYKR